MAYAKHLALGAAGEEATIRYLKGRGWRILARNWRPSGAAHGLELDIIGETDSTLVFVEVKTRSCKASQAGVSSGIPVLAAFSKNKRLRFFKAARQYQARHDLWDVPCRFDLICVTRNPSGEYRLEHYDNVIEFGDIVDSGNPPWQP